MREFPQPTPTSTADASSRSWLDAVLRLAMTVSVALVAFHLSLVATSNPLSNPDQKTVDRAIGILAERGFTDEAFILRNSVTYRSTDNWLNLVAEKENAFAATNFPFQIITLYPDFYNRLQDDTERAMVLLHEAQHLLNKDESAAYEYVWTHREQLGWTQASYGTSPVYVTVEQLTREHAPQLFECPRNLWSDCTQRFRSRAAR